MSTQIRRSVAARIVATLMAGLVAGTTLAVAGPVSEAQAMPRQCWYKGWFLEGGVWYQGWFLESC